MPLYKVPNRHCMMCTLFHVEEILDKIDSAMGFHWAGSYYVLSREKIAAEHKAMGILPLARVPIVDGDRVAQDIGNGPSQSVSLQGCQGA